MAILKYRAIERVARAVVLVAGLSLAAGSAAGQQPEAAASESEEVSLQTKDGVLLKATYYPSKAGKEAVPVILLHDHKGSRHELRKYAEFLQTEEPRPNGAAFTSLAVMVPDLRGHGDSTQQQFGNRVVELDAARLRQVDFANMVLQDMEAVRKFLLAENDEEKLNLNKLVIVGAGMGATVGLNWTARDWSAPLLATGKQGQDVKAVALISPQWSFKGVPVAQAMNHRLVSSRVSFFVTFGKRDSSQERDGERIFKIAEKGRAPYDPTQGKDKQEVFLFPWDTTQQGVELLLGHPRVGFEIREFIENRVVSQDFPWTERKVN